MSETPEQPQGQQPPAQNIYITQVQQAKPSGCGQGCGALIGLVIILAIIGGISQSCSSSSPTPVPSYPSSNCMSQGGTNPDC